MKKLLFLTLLTSLLMVSTGCGCSHHIVIDAAMAPTCTSIGLTEGSHCDLCGQVIVKQEVIPMLDHTIVIDEAVESSCSHIGLTEGSHCSECGIVLVPQEVIEKQAHSLVIDEAVESTCTHTGLTEGSHCGICGEILIAQQIVDKKPHNIVVDEGYPASCTHTGLTDGSHCSSCGEIIVPQEIIDEIEHEVVIDKGYAATYTSTGLTDGSHCSVCGKIIVEQQVIPKLKPYHVTFSVDSSCGTIIGQTDQYVLIGDSTLPVKLITNIDKKFVGWSTHSTERTYSFVPTSDIEVVAIFEDNDYQVPVIKIDMDDDPSSITKEEWLPARFTTISNNSKYCFDSLDGKIKGRGNSTWGMPKKPYKFKLEKKADLFGMGKAKKWVLLANYDDPSSLRNYYALKTGKVIEDISDFTTDIMFVEVYLNDTYLGLYNLVEQIEAGSNRVDICTDYTIDDTGYILEMDYRIPSEGVEGIDYFTSYGINYAVKAPDPDDDLKPSQMSFISNYVNDCFTAIAGTDYGEVERLIDVDTFAATYIVNEIFKTADVGGLSFYFYKDSGGKLCSGPLWDYDISCGNCNYNENCVNTNYLYAKEFNLWYRYLNNFDDFRCLVNEKIEYYYDAILSNFKNMYDFANLNADSFYRNFNIWQTIGNYVWPNPQDIVDLKSWEGNVTYLNNWLIKSLNFFSNAFK